MNDCYATPLPHPVYNIFSPKLCTHDQPIAKTSPPSHKAMLYLNPLRLAHAQTHEPCDAKDVDVAKVTLMVFQYVTLSLLLNGDSCYFVHDR